MSNPTIEIFNAITGENIIREMTDAEYAAEKVRIKSNEEITEQAVAEADAKAEAKTAVLAKLGLTEEEAKALIG